MYDMLYFIECEIFIHMYIGECDKLHLHTRVCVVFFWIQFHKIPFY